jgi:transposase-like protein
MVTTEIAKPASPASKHAQAFKLKMQGRTAAEIARVLGVSERTVYRYWKEHAHEYADSIKTESPVNVIADHLASLDEMERKALRQHERASGSRDEHAALSLALKIRQAKIDLQTKVGVLPTSPSQLYVSVDETASAAVSHRAPNEPATREEAIKKLHHLLIHERRMPDFSSDD